MEFLSEIRGLNLFCEFFIKSSVIFTFTFVLVFLFRKKSASLRYFLLSVSLLSLLLFPVLSSVFRGWETGLLPTWQSSEIRSLILQRGDPFSSTTSPMDSITPSLANQHLSTQTLWKNRRFSSFFTKYSISKDLVGNVLVSIWAAGLFALLFRIGLGLFGAHRLTQQGQKISGSPWRQLLNHFLKSISIKRKIDLLSHKKVNIPLTWGVIKPVVIFPAKSRNWTQDQRSSALFHELSHIKRGDFLIKFLARCSIALYWFNPLSWFAFRLMKKEQEKACDELVLKTGVKPSTYAVNLLSIKKAGQFQWTPPTAALGAVGKSQLNDRLVAILKQQLKPKEVNMKTKILLSSLIIMTIAFIGLARPSQSEAFTDTILPSENTVLSDTQEATQEVAVQEKQDKKTTEKTEVQESEDKTKKTFTWVSEDGEKITFFITVDEEGETKISGIDTDMVIDIDKDPDGNKFTLHVNDKNLVLQKDDKGNWSLQSDEGEKLDFQISTSLKFDKKYGVAYQIKGDKYSKNVVYIKAPKIQIEKIETPKGAVSIHVSPKIAIPNKTFDIHIIPEKGEAKWVKAEPFELHGIPHAKAFTIREAALNQKELKEKLTAIRDKLKEIREKNEQEMSEEAREEALNEVEEMLEELSEELKENKAEIKDIALSFHPHAEDVFVHADADVFVDVKEGDKMKWVSKENAIIDIEEGEGIAYVTTDEGEFQISMKANFDSKNKNKYEDIIKKLKEEFPEGYTVESVFDEDAGTITINIKGVQEGKKIGDEVKKILKDLEKQLSSIK